MPLFKSSRSEGSGDQHQNPRADQLRTAFPELVDKLISPDGQAAIRALWEQIDQSLTSPGPTQKQRLFSGISEDGARYFEVYQSGDGLDALSVFTAGIDPTQNAEPLRHSPGKGAQWRGDPPLRVTFADPALVDHKKCELGIRYVADNGAGTSSYRQGHFAGPGYEVFSIGRLQTDLDWPDGDIRQSYFDPSGNQAAPLEIHSPRPEPPQRDFDDLA